MKYDGGLFTSFPNGHSVLLTQFREAFFPPLKFPGSFVKNKVIT